MSQPENSIYWHCRRGMRELDLILIPYFKQCYHTLTAAQQADFIYLLEQADQDLWLWLRGGVIPDDPRLVTLVQIIKDFTEHKA